MGIDQKTSKYHKNQSTPPNDKGDQTTEKPIQQ